MPAPSLAPTSDTDASVAGASVTGVTVAGGSRRLWLEAVVWGCIAALWAAPIYRPWRWRPIGISDVANYLPLLQRGTSVLDRFRDLLEFYVERYGRVNVVVYAALAAKWSAFPDDPVAWYWIRFAVMCVVVALTYALLRRLGAGRIGAAVGSALFVVGGVAWQAWTVLSIGEPMGVLLVLVALHLLVGYQEAARWGRRAAAAGVLLLAALLAKEMLICLVPLAVLVGACHRREREWELPRPDARTAAVVGACAAATATAGALLVWGLRHARSAAYASPYDPTSIDAAKVLDRLGKVMLPLESFWPDERAATVLVDAAFVIVLWAGAMAALRGRTRRQLAWSFGVAVVTPLVGAVLYAPWPNFARFYGLPMLVGPAMLLALALTFLRDRSARAHHGAAAVAIVALAITSLAARRRADAQSAQLRVTDELVRRIAELPPAPANELVYLTRYRRPGVWEGQGNAITQYAFAAHRIVLPRARDADCRESPALRASAEPRILVTFAEDCSAFDQPVVSARETFGFVRLTGGMGLDSMRADAILQRATLLGAREADAPRR